MFLNLSKKDPFPSDVSIDITSHCNIDCIICSLKKEYHPKGFMSHETFSKLRPLLEKAKNIELCCNAEPTLHQELITFLEETKKNSNAKVNFPTNGLLLNEKLIKELINGGLDNLRISLDGATPKTYNNIRRGSDFQKVIGNIKTINKLKKELGSQNPNLVFVFVAIKRNIHELPALIDLANQFKVRDITVHGFECYSKKLEDEILYLNHHKEMEEYFKKAKEKSEAYDIRLQLPQTQIKEAHCCDRNKSCLITWDGDVCPCTPLSYKREVYQNGRVAQLKKVHFGNVNESAFKDIWGSKEYREFRKFSSREKYEPCRDCLMNKNVIVPQQDQS